MTTSILELVNKTGQHNSINFTAVNDYLKEEKLDCVPNATQLLNNRIRIVGYLASGKDLIGRCLLGRIAIYSTSIGLAFTGVAAHLLGLRNLSKKIIHCADFLHVGKEIELLPKALVRTINFAKEADLSREHAGICAGASIYFNYIYSKLSERGGDQKDLLIKCANLFAEGGSETAVNLHWIFSNNFVKEDGLLKDVGPHLLRLVPDDQLSSLEKGMVFYQNQDDLKKLVNGPHIVRLYNQSGFHVISLIKISDERCYIFDPSFGLFEFEGADFPDKIVQYLNSAYRSSHKYHYLRYLRREQSNPEIKASAFKEMYVQILPMLNTETSPTFPSVSIPNLQTPPTTRRIGCLEDAWERIADLYRASL